MSTHSTGNKSLPCPLQPLYPNNGFVLPLSQYVNQDEWRHISDMEERRKVQNRLNQRNHRSKARTSAQTDDRYASTLQPFSADRSVGLAQTGQAASSNSGTGNYQPGTEKNMASSKAQIHADGTDQADLPLEQGDWATISQDLVDMSPASHGMQSPTTWPDCDFGPPPGSNTFTDMLPVDTRPRAGPTDPLSNTIQGSSEAVDYTEAPEEMDDGLYRDRGRVNLDPHVSARDVELRPRQASVHAMPSQKRRTALSPRSRQDYHTDSRPAKSQRACSPGPKYRRSSYSVYSTFSQPRHRTTSSCLSERPDVSALEDKKRGPCQASTPPCGRRGCCAHTTLSSPTEDRFLVTGLSSIHGHRPDRLETRVTEPMEANRKSSSAVDSQQLCQAYEIGREDALEALASQLSRTKGSFTLGGGAPSDKDVERSITWLLQDAGARDRVMRNGSDRDGSDRGYSEDTAEPGWETPKRRWTREAPYQNGGLDYLRARLVAKSSLSSPLDTQRRQPTLTGRHRDADWPTTNNPSETPLMSNDAVRGLLAKLLKVADADDDLQSLY